jgi:hypothetical protein
MSESMSNAAQELMRKTRAGASFWTTFRWVADIVYGLCWMVALPAELLLNRRIGRRYASMLPLCISFLLLVGIYSSFGWAMAALEQSRTGQPTWMDIVPRLEAPALTGQPLSTPTPAPRAAAVASLPAPLSGNPYFLPGIMLILSLAVLGHRLDNWWRFRTTEQVHSRACGIPHWVWWCWQGIAADAQKTAKPSVVTEAKPAAAGVVAAATPTSIFMVLQTEFQSMVRGSIKGVPPTGALAWLSSTVVHPVALLIGGVLVLRVDFMVGAHTTLVAVAIFIKARIQKALVVEAIYDVFDARLERVFMRGLEEPEDLAAAGRAGMVVPGVARLMPGAISRLPKSSPLAPEYQSLVTVLR